MPIKPSRVNASTVNDDDNDDGDADDVNTMMTSSTRVINFNNDDSDKLMKSW